MPRVSEPGAMSLKRMPKAIYWRLSTQSCPAGGSSPARRPIGDSPPLLTLNREMRSGPFTLAQGTTPRRCRACKLRQLGFCGYKRGKAAIEADQKSWKYKDPGFVSISKARKMNIYFGRKLRLIRGGTNCAGHGRTSNGDHHAASPRPLCQFKIDRILGDASSFLFILTAH